MKNIIKYFQVFTAVTLVAMVISCGSDDEKPVVVEEYDGDYFGISTLNQTNIVGVWNITVLNGKIAGIATYIEEDRTISAPLSGVVRASGAFDIEINYADNLLGSIAGLIELSGSVSGSWDSEGVSGQINGNKEEYRDERFDGSYSGTAENSIYTWNFNVDNGIIEGEFSNQKFASFVGLQGSTLKLIELTFVLDEEPVRVVFEIHDDGTVTGLWNNQNDDSIGGDIEGVEG